MNKEQKYLFDLIQHMKKRLATGKRFKDEYGNPCTKAKYKQIIAKTARQLSSFDDRLPELKAAMLTQSRPGSRSPYFGKWKTDDE